MIYFFERNSIELRIEAQFDPATDIYTIIKRLADGSSESEKVWGQEPCRRRLEVIGTDLLRDGWRASRPPVFVF